MKRRNVVNDKFALVCNNTKVEWQEVIFPLQNGNGYVIKTGNDKDKLEMEAAKMNRFYVGRNEFEVYALTSEIKEEVKRLSEEEAVKREAKLKAQMEEYRERVNS